MNFDYAYLIASIFLLLIWLFLYWLWLKPQSRQKMLLVSLVTAPLGLTEPFFVPSYWSPFTLFNLAGKTGFDLESFIFSFAIGGLAAVLYEAFFPVRHRAFLRYKKVRMQLHRLALVSPFLIFLILFLGTPLNPIYVVLISLFAGSLFAMLCRPDLLKKVLLGGVLFLGLYFLFFLVFTLFFPAFVEAVWNLPALSGILLLGIPLEELLFAFSVGLLWSSIYEHAHFYRVVRVKKVR